ncbi:hypothetical protein N008_16855 [Hymenobacter sp. APR13]|nr:hypothetical protein N008_16855 [Hymenobacter sp. APR13]
MQWPQWPQPRPWPLLRHPRQQQQQQLLRLPRSFGSLCRLLRQLQPLHLFRCQPRPLNCPQRKCR